MDRDKTYHGKIITHSGRTFDIQRPTVDMLDINDIAHSLSMQCRYNGHIPTFYSVAEHSVRVASFLEEQGESALMCLTGLMHDAAEAYIGDMVHPMKRIPAIWDTYRRYEETIEELIAERWNLVYPMPDVVKEADKANYEWEVDHIRTGHERGWPHFYAEERFLSFFVQYGGYMW